MLYEINTARLHLSNIHLTNHLYSMDFLTERNELELGQAIIKGLLWYTQSLKSNQLRCQHRGG